MILGICPERCGGSCPIRKSERAGPAENRHPPHSIPRPRDQKLIGILTTAMPDYGQQPGRTSTLGWSVIAVKPNGKGWGRQDVATARLMTKIHQNGSQNVIFWHHVQKDSEDVFAGIGIAKNLILENFVQNLMSRPVQLGLKMYWYVKQCLLYLIRPFV